MSEASFVVAYTGPGVEDGRMSVRQLAPTLLAIGELIEDSNRILNGDAAHVNVRIRPASRRGSALIELAMQFGLTEQVQAFVDPATLTDARQLLALLGFLDPEGQVIEAIERVRNVIEFIRVLGSGEVEEKTVYEDGSVHLEIRGVDGDVNTYNAPKNIVDLGTNKNIRASLEEIITDRLREPLIDGFSTRDPEDEDRVIEQVEKREAPLFEAERAIEESGGPVDSGEFTDWVTARKAWTIQPSRKWQFEGTGGQPFNAVITDEEFWEQMDRDIIYPTPHAKFHVRVEWEQEHEDADPEYTVVEVLGYEPAEPRTGDLDLEPDGESG